VVIDEDELLEAVVRVTNEGNPANAGNVRDALGQIADDGEYFDVMVVAVDLEELESLGKLERAPHIDWGGSEPMPKTRIAYELRYEKK
jgi:hypothetical protein